MIESSKYTFIGSNSIRAGLLKGYQKLRNSSPSGEKIMSCICAVPTTNTSKLVERSVEKEPVKANCSCSHPL